MKKKYTFLLTVIGVLITLAFIVIIRFYTKTYSVTFDTKGGTIYQTMEIKPGEKPVVPPDPIMEGYKFIGWFYNDKEYDPEMEITGDTIIVAHWEKVNIKTISID